MILDHIPAGGSPPPPFLNRIRIVTLIKFRFVHVTAVE
jgi:hypothetical protein